MSYFQYTLPNGLRIILEPTDSKVAYCGYAINAGTRDESEAESGMAHLVEHLLFKGTKHRKAWHILNRMENVGGDLNAYTNKEETIVYSAFLVEHFSRAVELLTDIVFYSTYPEEELHKEVEVIIEEILSYRDSPSELIFDEFETMLFQEHPLGRDILGDEKQLKKYVSQRVLAFTNRYYRPNNMVFFVRGKLTSKRVVSVLERFTDGLTQEIIPLHRDKPLLLPAYTKVVRKDTHQSHVMIGSRSYNYFDQKRDALYLLNNVLGGPGMNSKLNIALREKHGLVYSVESNMTSYTDAGLFSIYFGADVKDSDKCIDLIRKELKDLRENRLSSLKLSMAKKQLIGQIGVASDSSESLALGMGKTYLHFNKCDTFETIYKKITSLTSVDLLSVANEVLDEDKLYYLIYK
ncbi:M16 family metallopeptidase [Bacteroides coprosuis]|uniref:M16 family metallopeptidase n=1 Tax=Bacteroides coprosuis TaxID=151276 RepID=UPI001D476214|nr:pitrilysin family protein [Bacteroides coprosuis]HJD92685.1 insulinase family protein [Bacteroides coprosuis]